MPAIDTSRILAQAARLPWTGMVYRVHGPTWDGDSATGSLFGSGRWHLGRDLLPTAGRTFPVLYTSTAPVVATWEFLRHVYREDGDEMWQRMHVKISHLEVSLPVVLDLRPINALGIPAEVISGANYEEAQAIALAAYDAGLSGLLAPSATSLGAPAGDYNVIVFFEETGRQTTVYGYAAPETVPRAGVTVRVVSVERPALPPP